MSFGKSSHSMHDATFARVTFTGACPLVTSIEEVVNLGTLFESVVLSIITLVRSLRFRADGRRNFVGVEIQIVHVSSKAIRCGL